MNIFVGNLAKSITAEDLRRVFSDYGTVVNAVVMKDAATGQPLGCAKVLMEPAHAGAEAIDDLHAAPLKGKPIIAREYVNRGTQERRVARTPWNGKERRRRDRRRDAL